MTLSDANAPQFEVVERPPVPTPAPAEDTPAEDSEDDNDGREN